MKTFISDIIPKIQRFSQKLDNLTLLTNQHWILLGELQNSKVVYIFRKNGQLLVSQNGNVEKAIWEYLDSNSLLIDRGNESYLFRHGFLDENILALKVDGIEEYAFFVNETKFIEEINSMQKAVEFLTKKYLDKSKRQFENYNFKSELVSYRTNLGEVKIPPCISYIGQPVILNDKPAPDGKYRLSLLDHIYVRDGIVVKESAF